MNIFVVRLLDNDRKWVCFFFLMYQMHVYFVAWKEKVILLMKCDDTQIKRENECK
jgi:hypothetical protein